jgi:hypothetical protein
MLVLKWRSHRRSRNTADSDNQLVFGKMEKSSHFLLLRFRHNKYQNKLPRFTTMNLTDYPWRISYSSNENNPIADFYIPSLECARQYDRKSGFFNSAILSKVAQGLGAMLHNQGRMRLIMGCQFSPQDLQAIQQGYALRDAVTMRLDTDLQPPKPSPNSNILKSSVG